MLPKNKRQRKVETEEVESEEEVETPLDKSKRNSKRNAEEPIEKPPGKKAKKDPKQLMNHTETDLNEIDFTCETLNSDGEKFNLKICSWNVSGIRSVIKKGGFDYIKKEDPDIIALQEVKCEDTKLPNEVKIPGYQRFFLESKKKGYCGMALFSKIKPLKVMYGLQNAKFDDEGRMITAEYENFFVINVYVPNAGNKLINLPKRLAWNIAFKEHVNKLDKKKPVIICGDMNVAHQEIDLTNPKKNLKNAGFSKEERDDMTDLLGNGFVDSFRYLYPNKTDTYTFWTYCNNARSKNIGWRLDYFILSERIKEKICDSVMRDKIHGSDHCPIVLYAHL